MANKKISFFRFFEDTKEILCKDKTVVSFCSLDSFGNKKEITSLLQEEKKIFFPSLVSSKDKKAIVKLPRLLFCYLVASRSTILLPNAVL